MPGRLVDYQEVSLSPGRQRRGWTIGPQEASRDEYQRGQSHDDSSP
ncbi:MAG TPA: hypothetical protein VEU54_00930 [Steroidobacteraceae bacterium]|nr:hypothetical protein [Steroidobacteraceae bacterium]